MLHYAISCLKYVNLISFAPESSFLVAAKVQFFMCMYYLYHQSPTTTIILFKDIIFHVFWCLVMVMAKKRDMMRVYNGKLCIGWIKPNVVWFTMIYFIFDFNFSFLYPERYICSWERVILWSFYICLGHSICSI